MRQEVRDHLIQLARVPAAQRYDKYLGLPALVGKSRLKEFQSLAERVHKRVNDWKVKEILLKVVVQAILTYTMNIFLLPKTLCKEINAITQRFWWGHQENVKKIHWMSWEKMGWSKSQGGMGFRDLQCFIKELLAKQCWRLVQHPQNLAALIVKAKYFPKNSFLEAKLGSQPSLV
jgi:hypothetical protein